MNKKPVLITLISLFILCLANLAIAGESRSISISIVIPEIPGVNVPLIQEEAIQTKMDSVALKQDTQSLEEADENEAPQTLQEDKEEIRLVEGGSKSVAIVRTMYSR